MNVLYKKELLTKGWASILFPLVISFIATVYIFSGTSMGVVQMKSESLIGLFTHNLISCTITAMLTDIGAMIVAAINSLYLGFVIATQLQYFGAEIVLRLYHLPLELFGWYLAIVMGYLIREHFKKRRIPARVFVQNYGLLVIVLFAAATIENLIIRS